MYKNSFEEDINDFIELRINECYNILSKNKNYKKVSKKYYELLNQIEKALNNDKIISDYIKSELDMYGFQSEEAYKCGFFDCLNIMTKCINKT